MKNKFIYLMVVLFAASVCFSCSDDDNNGDSTDFTGTWNYGSKGDIHFAFDYAEDNISIPQGIVDLIPTESLPPYMAGMDLTSIPASAVNMFLPPYAKGQMQKYFRGITFLANQQMEILMTMNDLPMSVKTTYEVQKDVLKVNIQSEDFQKLTGGKIPAMIESIDLKYIFKDNKLTLYLNTEYIKMMLTAAPAMMASVDMSEDLKKDILAFISDFSKNTRTLEIGAILSR